MKEAALQPPFLPLFEWNDHLVGANQAQILSDHFVRQVGIGLAGIEQRRFVAKAVALGFQFGQLSPAGIQLLRVAAPRENAVRPSDGVAGEGSHHKQSGDRPCRAADQSDAVRLSPHTLRRIRKTP